MYGARWMRASFPLTWRTNRHSFRCLPRTADIVALEPKAYAFHMNENPLPSRRNTEGQMKLIALLMYVAEQKRKSMEIAEQLFHRLMRPGNK